MQAAIQQAMASESSSFHAPVRLFVHVQRAVELNAADPNGKSDPYCVVHLGSPGEQLFKTEIKYGTLSPEWNEKLTIQNKQLSPFVFIAGDSIHLYGYLVVDVWDHDSTNPDDFLGRVMIALGEIPSDQPNEAWYALMKRNTKDGKISGSLKLSTQLLVDGISKTIERDKMSDYVYTKSQSLGFHLSLFSEKEIVELPGRTESVEMAFSRVMIDISSHHCTAQVFLTNFRLIILSTSGHSKSHRYHGRGASIDLSMWIALNNIMSVEMSYNSIVLHRHKSGQRKTRTVSITIHCYDIRVVKLTFIADMDATTLADYTDGKSPEFLASTNSSSQQQGERERVTGDGGGVHDRIAQKIKDFATQSPKLLKGMTDKVKGVGGVGGGANISAEALKNPRLLQQQHPGAFTKSLTSIGPIPEESPEHKNFTQEDPFEVGEFRGRSRSAAMTQEPKELGGLNGSNSAKSQSLKPPILQGDESCISLISLDKCSNVMDDDYDSDDSYDMLMDEGDSIFFGDSMMMDESCTTTVSRVPTEDGCGSNDDVIVTSSSSVKFPISSSVQLRVFFARLEHLILNAPEFPPAQTFVKKFQGFIQLKGWDFYSFPKEMDRQGVCDSRWSLSVLNGPQYELCSTYPQLMYIPTAIDAQTVVECSKFRSRNRLPCLVWVDKKYHNFMLRCAQPLTGKSGRRSTSDEQLIEAAIKAGPQDGHMFIFDARTFSAATGNKIMGKGTEMLTGYPRSKLQYLAIPNIHAVRESYDSLRSLCLSMTSSKWHSSLENTQWLNYISLILKGSTMIARYMKLQRGNALVHCSDGWDRTSQLTSLSQLMMDPYYRTMEGFQTLVDKEWLSFGHKFQHRLGHPDHPNERSPIFFQFLDCVHQILTQYPTIFEFKLSYLLCIADHLNTAWFGTFMCNCDKERYDLSLYATTASLWAHLIAEKDKFVNPEYVFTKQAIFPITNIRRLRLWEEYFLRYDFTMYTLRGGRQVEDNTTDHSPSVISHRHSLRGSWTSEAVVWMSDDKTNECCYCQQKFNAFRRRHHCRACGRIFCNDCSKNRMALAHLGYYTPERVCDECFRKLNGAQKSEDGEDEFVMVMKVKH